MSLSFYTAKQYDLIDLVVLWGKEQLWFKDLRKSDTLVVMKDKIGDKEIFIGGGRIRHFSSKKLDQENKIKSTPFCELCNIAIDKKYRHKGYGSALINELVNRTWAKYDIYLICKQELTDFYGPLGFVHILHQYVPQVLSKKCEENELIMKYMF